MQAEVRQEVSRRLDSIEAEDKVRIVYACESGSRAWGFESEDSDFDVRFLYVHPRDWYLSIESRRDVIERPITDVYDINGWDLRKALSLFRKSNPPLLEWLGSPIIYRERGSVATRLRELARSHHSPRACAYHYLHMAHGNYREYLRGEQVRTKKYLYVLRPLLAIRWIERGLGVVPTEFEHLVRAVVDDSDLEAAIGDLVARKRTGPELGTGPRIAPISDYIEIELARLEAGLDASAVEQLPAQQLDRVFRECLDDTWENGA